MVFPMKKLLQISALAIALVMMLATLASCSGPADDADDARRALIKNDYEVMLVDDDNEATIAALEQEYDLFGLEEYLTAMDNEDYSKAENVIIIFYFDETRDAKDSMEGIEKLVEDMKKDMKASGVDIDSMDLELDRSGEVIWWGTPDAVKAAR